MAFALAARPITTHKTQSAQNEIDGKKTDNNNNNTAEIMYDIDCKQSASANGIFSLKQCVIKQISGEQAAVSAPSIQQQVQYLNLNGIVGNASGGAPYNNTIHHLNLEIFPFGSVRNVIVSNSTEVDN